MDLALFDLDETLIDDDSASLWIRWLVAQGFAPAELELQEQQLMQLYYQASCRWRITCRPRWRRWPA